jgi:hypothetical protein
MPRTGGGRYNREDVDEKKDHPRRDGSERGDQKASHEDRFDDPQEKQAKGTRFDHMAGGNKAGEKSRSQGPDRPAEPGSNTTSGGNRPKGVHHRQGRVDHN